TTDAAIAAYLTIPPCLIPVRPGALSRSASCTSLACQLADEGGKLLMIFATVLLTILSTSFGFQCEWTRAVPVPRQTTTPVRTSIMSMGPVAPRRSRTSYEALAPAPPQYVGPNMALEYH